MSFPEGVPDASVAGLLQTMTDQLGICGLRDDLLMAVRSALPEGPSRGKASWSSFVDR
jgi:hypothetical protein